MNESVNRDRPSIGFWRWFLPIGIPLYFLDQLTKFWVTWTFSDPPHGFNYTPGEAIEVIPGFLQWVRVHNQGVAFGLGNGTDWAPFVFPAISVTAFGFIWLGWKKNFFTGRLGHLSAILLVTGICGNLTDRLVQGFRLDRMQGASWWNCLKEGYVVDFINVTIPFTSGWQWPSFNVADSCISIAAVLLFLTGWHHEAQDKKEKVVLESD